MRNLDVVALAPSYRDRLAASPSEIGAKTFEAETFDAKASGAATFEAKAFAAMPEEIRLRLLLRAIDRFGHEGPAELGKVEAMLSVLGRAMTEPSSRRRPRLKQTLAGALVSLIDDRITVAPSPPRRRRSD